MSASSSTMRTLFIRHSMVSTQVFPGLLQLLVMTVLFLVCATATAEGRDLQAALEKVCKKQPVSGNDGLLLIPNGCRLFLNRPPSLMKPLIPWVIRIVLVGGFWKPACRITPFRERVSKRLRALSAHAHSRQSSRSPAGCVCPVYPAIWLQPCR